MTAPQKRPGPQLREMQGIKSLMYVAIVVMIYIWASTGLGIAPSKFVEGDTWRNMSDLVIRMGPFHRINTCRNAEIVWGNDEPLSGKPDPAKVQAVCEYENTLYWYDYDLLKEQVAYAKDVWDPLMTTFQMAILGAFMGAVLAIPFSLMASRNLVKSKWLYYSVRTVLNLIRTIPDLVLAAILSGMFGLGALPAVLALTIFSFALIAKLLSESIESIDPGPLEAIQAVGGNKLQQIAYGVVPQVLPQFLAYSIYVLEIDVRASTILGLVGAGGIGQLLYADLNLLRYRNVGAVILMMFISVILMDLVSTKVRERLV